MAITPFIEFEGNDAAHAMGKSGSGRVFLWQEKETPGQAWPGAKEEDHAPMAPAYLISTPRRTVRSARSP